MATQADDLAAVLRRLDALEKQTRLWKGISLLALLGLVTGMLMGAVQPPAQDVVVAKRFQLVDDNGKIRADWVMSGFKQPALVLYDDKGKERITLRIAKEGPQFLCFDTAGKQLRTALGGLTRRGVM